MRASAKGISTAAEPSRRSFSASSEPTWSPSVRDGDPADDAARALCRPDEVVGAASGRRIHEREAVVLSNEVGVDESQTDQLGQVVAQRDGLHGLLQGALAAVVPRLAGKGIRTSAA
jgi:hypothetical protein